MSKQPLKPLLLMSATNTHEIVCDIVLILKIKIDPMKYVIWYGPEHFLKHNMLLYIHSSIQSRRDLLAKRTKGFIVGKDAMIFLYTN